MTFRLVRPDQPDPPMVQPHRRWRDKFREALKGVKLGIRGQSSFFVHFFAATLVVVAANTLQCNTMEWCILIGCIGLVLTAELIHSAIEAIFKGLDPAARAKHHAALHVAAGAVLVACITAAAIGLILLGQKLWQHFGTGI